MFRSLFLSSLVRMSLFMCVLRQFVRYDVITFVLYFFISVLCYFVCLHLVIYWSVDYFFIFRYFVSSWCRSFFLVALFRPLVIYLFRSFVLSVFLYVCMYFLRSFIRYFFRSFRMYVFFMYVVVCLCLSLFISVFV